MYLLCLKVVSPFVDVGNSEPHFIGDFIKWFKYALSGIISLNVNQSDFLY